MAMDLAQWRNSTTKNIFAVTLQRVEAESSAWRLTWLKELAAELAEENGGSVPTLDPSLADRVLIARLSLDPQGDVMSDDAEKLQVLASLPEDSTSWDYLCTAWKRCRAEEMRVRKTLGANAAAGIAALEEIRALLVSYMGLILQDAFIFPCSTKGSLEISPLVLVPSLLKESTGQVSGDPYTSSASTIDTAPRKGEWVTIDAVDLPVFLRDLAERFKDEGLDAIMEPAIREITRQVRDGRGSSAEAAAGPSAAGGAAPGGGAQQSAALQAAAAAGDVRAVLAHLLANPGAAQGQAAQAAPPPPRREGMNIDGLDWRSYMTAVIELADVKQIAAVLPSMPSFTPESATAASLEHDALIGPLLRLSCFADVAPAIAMQYFPDIERRDDITSGMSTLRTTLGVVHTLHFRLLNACVRAGPQSREGVLHFWGHACQLNKRRGVMRVKAREVATDGFMVNLFETLLRFAEPFMDPTYSKIDRIDVEYLRRQKRFDVSDLTRLSATEQEAAKWAEEAGPVAAPPNFITEVFYLAVRLNNLGLGKAIRTFNDLSEQMRKVKKQADEYEADRADWQADPNAAQYEAFIKKAKADTARMQSFLLAAETQLLDPEFLTRTLTFTSFVMTWLVRVADPRATHPQTQVELPLPKEAPMAFRMLPEHIFEDVCDTLIFLGRYKPDALPEAVKNDLITFCTTFLSSGWYIKNPFLKAKLAEILFFFVLPYGNQKQGFVSEQLNFHKLALQHLVPAVMSFWVEAESTGSHTQFYDKFNIRYHLARVFTTIWSNPQHKERLHQEAEKNVESFIIFVNRLLNDVTFLLDDSLERLVELHRQEAEIDDKAAWEAKTLEERREHEGHMRGNEGHARSMLQFGNEFLRTLIDFSAEPGRVRDSFMQPEIVSRLAPMLDYTLDTLVGPRCQELKLKNPKKSGFDPKHLLRQILSVFLNLAARPEFIQAMAKDERSYKRSIFEKAARIAERHMLKSPPELETLMKLVEQVEAVKAADLEEEEDLGEIPDDFCDPLMATLMKDPVILPSSRTIVDLSTIKSHLLSDATDPFNRVPLKIEDVHPAVELKAQITAWLAERKQAKLDAVAAAAAAATSSSS